MTQDTKNLILAMGLSILVLIGWNYFFGIPQIEKARQARVETTVAKPANPGQQADASLPALPAPAGTNPPAVTNSGSQPALTRDQAIGLSPRITIDTPDLKGSIALKGARIDDVALKGYRETTDKNSPNIILLSPSGSPAPYYAEAGFVAEPGTSIPLPGRDTLWQASAPTLTPEVPVVLTWDNGQGLVFRRTIKVDAHFMFTLTDSVENKGTSAVKLFPYALVSRHGRPQLSGYAVLHEGLLGIVGDSRIQEITYDAIEKEPQQTKTLKGTGGWIGFTDKYWATAVIPDQQTPFDARFLATGTTSKIYQTDVFGQPRDIAPGTSSDVTTRIFAGAKVTDMLETYQNSQGIRNFDLMIDWGWFYFITKPMFWMIDFLYRFTGNFGVAILLVTVLVKAAFFPLANRSYLSMAKMKSVQPQMAALKERYPDDKQKQQQELMELYKREKINPVAGCLPVIIQIPVFFALYKVLFVTIEMRQAPFFGWIHDLSAPDPTNIFNLLGLIPFDPTQLPLFGHFLALGVWPVIMGVSMFIQMKMNPEPPDPVQKQMFAWMPVIFTFMLGTFPSGLVIYWTWNNLLSVSQQALIMHKAGVKIELWDNLTALFGKKETT